MLLLEKPGSMAVSAMLRLLRDRPVGATDHCTSPPKHIPSGLCLLGHEFTSCRDEVASKWGRFFRASAPTSTPFCVSHQPVKSLPVHLQQRFWMSAHLASIVYLAWAAIF